MAEAVASIPFITGHEDRARSLSIRLDPDLNNDMTEFPLGTEVILQIMSYPDDLDISDRRVSSGRLETYSPGGTATFTEFINFEATDRGYTNYPIANDGIEEMEWIGTGLGNITWQGANELRSERAGVAVLKITYVTNTRRLKLKNVNGDEGDEEEWPVLVYIKGGQDGDDDRPTASLTVNFSGPGGGTCEYVQEVRNYCTGELIGGAQIWLDGVDKGATPGFGNNMGVLSLGQLVIGRSYTLTIQKSGFDSFEDVTFTVPEPQEDEGC